MKTLMDTIAKIESSNNQFAYRFEPVTFQDKPTWIVKQVPTILKYNPCFSFDSDTGLAMGCTSLGYYQILGANIWSNGFTGSYANFLYNKSSQDNVFDQFIASHGYSSNEDITNWTDDEYMAFAIFYNGPGNPTAYMAKMKAA